MAAIAVVIAAPVVFGTTTAGLVAGAAVGLLAAYADQQLIYPNLFGKRDQKPGALEGFQLSTTDPGAPRWDVFGVRAWVPSHYIWATNIRDEISGNGQVGKGGRPFVQTARIDAGIAVANGPIARISTIYADERPFWTRDPNPVIMEDHRWSIFPSVAPSTGFLIFRATDADVPDFSGAFPSGDGADRAVFVRVEGVTPATLNGYYRLYLTVPHSGSVRTTLWLRPLQGQPLVNGVAGSLFEPARIRRIDQGAAAHDWYVENLAGNEINLQRPIATTLVNVPSGDDAKRWVVGGRYRFSGWRDGVWELLGVFPQAFGPPGPPPYLWLGGWKWKPVGTAASTAAPTGTFNLPLIIARDETGDFLFRDTNADPSKDQGWREYLGTSTQNPDPTLALSYPNTTAHRGIAHLSVANWNLGPHGNLVPRVTALVRARISELVGSAIQRICYRSSPEGSVDVSRLRQKGLLGYAIPGGMSGIQALQPLLTMHAVVMQDRGGVMTFLDERDLPIVPVATRHLNAKAPGQNSEVRGFDASRVDKADIPERVQILYVNPTGENEAESDGDRAPGFSSSGRRDLLQVNIRPMVAFPYDVKRRARQLKQKVQIETRRGIVDLPPNYMDVLPGTILTFMSNNRSEQIAPANTTIGLNLKLRDITPGSIRVRVRFADAKVATLSDVAGKLTGLPTGITASVNSINYETGRVDLSCSTNLDTSQAPRILYEYKKQWVLRASTARLGGFDFSVRANVVTTSTAEPLPPVPRDPQGIGGPIGTEIAAHRSHVIDAPAAFGPTSDVLIAFAMAPNAGGVWRGGTVFQSPNGEDRWTVAAQLQREATVGTTVGTTLPSRIPGGANPAIVDWTTNFEIDLPRGEVLSDATLAEISIGRNWMLVGNEIIGFHQAVAGVGTRWTLRGLVRALRMTIADMDTHAADERVIMLDSQSITYFEPVGGLTAAGRNYFFRIVPGGASVDTVETTTVYVRGRSALAAPPYTDATFLRQTAGGIRFQWYRRSLYQRSLFGPAAPAPGEIEQYRVDAFDYVAAGTLVAGGLSWTQAIAATVKQRWYVGDANMGTNDLVTREVTYATADYTSHGFGPGDRVGFIVWQINGAGMSDPSDFLDILLV